MRHFLRFSIFDFFSKQWVWKMFLILGIVFRVAHAFYSGMETGEDEQFLFSALHKIANGSFLPLANVTFAYKNLFAWLLYVFMLVLSAFGMDNVYALSSAVYLFMGFISLLFVWGGFRLTKNLTVEKPYAYFALSVFAVHFAMPLACVKTQPQTVAMFFIPWAFYFFTKPLATAKDYFWGAFLLSFSGLFYFPNFIFVAVSFLYMLYKFFSSRKTRTYIYSFFMGIIPALLVAALLDVLAKKIPFASIGLFFADVFADFSYHAYSLAFYGGISLLIFIPPFSFLLLKALWKGIKRSSLLSSNFFIFFLFLLFHGTALGINFLSLFPFFIVFTAAGLSGCSKKSWANAAVSLFLLTDLVLLFLSF